MVPFLYIVSSAAATWNYRLPILSPCTTLFEMLFYRINKESIIDVEGEVKLAAQKVQSCSQEDVEVFVDKVWLSKNF